VTDVIVNNSVIKGRLPKGWSVQPIESLCTRVTSGGTPSRKVRDYYEGGTILWVKSSELKDWYIHDTSEKITDKALGASSAKLLPTDTVLLALYGDGRTITSLGILAREASCNQACCAMICDPGEIRPHFLLYSLKHHRSVLIGLASGASQRNLSGKILRQFPIAVPPLPTQRKIAGVLSAYDDLIENNTRRIAILEEMARAIYREWFVHFRFPGHESARFTDSPIGKIPEGWKGATLGDLARETRRAVDPTEIDPETPYIGLEHLPRRSITLGEWGTAKDVQSTKLAFNAGEILFGKIRPYFHKVGVAPVDGVCSSDAIVIGPKTPSAFGPVLCCVSSDEFVSHATQTSQGTKMPRANWDVLVKYPLPIPPNGLLNRFNSIVEDMVTTLRLLMLKNRNLRTTRDLLLPKLIAGQLDVEDLDIADE
jgi:type I restriction enzyme S subunit